MLKDINANWLAQKVASDIREGALLGALAYYAAHGSVKDDISDVQAYRQYGKSWVQNEVRLGNLHFVRIGSTSKSTKLYSVFEIETLKRAQKCIAQEYENALRNAQKN